MSTGTLTKDDINEFKLKADVFGFANFDPNTGTLSGASAGAMRSSVGMIVVDVTVDGGGLDQWAAVQYALNSAIPGQRVVLPRKSGWVKASNIVIPPGVLFSTLGAGLLGANVRFSSAISQAYNAKIHDLWLKQCHLFIEADGDTGTPSAVSGLNFTDATKAWSVDQWKYCYVKITSGPGLGQVKRVISNTSNTLTISSAWRTGDVPDATSQYELYPFLTNIQLESLALDGTDSETNGNSTSGDAIKVGKYGFKLKAHNIEVYNYTGWGLKQVGNSDPVANTGTSFLAANVFNSVSQSTFFNLGAAADGGCILCMGGAQDGSSLHLGDVLLDTSQRALHVINSVSGASGTTPMNSGGWTVEATNLRVERCGNIVDPTGQQSGTTNSEAILFDDISGSLTINGLWYKSSIDVQFYKNVYVKGGHVQVKGGKFGKGRSDAYGLFCDQGYNAIWDIYEAGTKYNIGALRPMLVSDAVSNGRIISARFRITKVAGSAALTIQNVQSNGSGFGLGGIAGSDVLSTTVSGNLTKTMPDEISVGVDRTQIFYQLFSAGNAIKVRFGALLMRRVLQATICSQNAGISAHVDMTTSFNSVSGSYVALVFTDSSGAAIDLTTSMADGKFIDVMVTLSASTSTPV